MGAWVPPPSQRLHPSQALPAISIPENLFFPPPGFSHPPSKNSTLLIYADFRIQAFFPTQIHPDFFDSPAANPPQTRFSGVTEASDQLNPMDICLADGPERPAPCLVGPLHHWTRLLEPPTFRWIPPWDLHQLPLCLLGWSPGQVPRSTPCVTLAPAPPPAAMLAPRPLRRPHALLHSPPERTISQKPHSAPSAFVAPLSPLQKQPRAHHNLPFLKEAPALSSKSDASAGARIQDSVYCLRPSSQQPNCL